MSSGGMSHGWAPAFYDHVDHRIVVFYVWKNKVNVVCYLLSLGFVVAHGASLTLRLQHTGYRVPKLSASMLFNLRPASTEIISLLRHLLPSFAYRLSSRLS